MAEVVIFGGTTEGRELAETCVRYQVSACVCVVSDYGEQLLPQDERITICTGMRNQAAMEELLKREQPILVLDATHPYATLASEHAKAACANTGLSYQRILRSAPAGKSAGVEIWVDSIEEAIPFLAQDEEVVLVTTGSKELYKYKNLSRYRERLYARVLASHEGLAACEELGLHGSHIVAMQGPFSQELNEALLKQIGAGWIVTKESGGQGGFAEKVGAARAARVKTIIIGRPKAETGISLADACTQLAKLQRARKRELLLIGIGMGSPELLTGEAVLAIRSCDGLLGAPRMLAAVCHLNPLAEVAAEYLPADIDAWIARHPGLQRIGVLLSGDTGFYSGAKAIKRLFAAQSTDWDVRTLPGISTVSYLCARIGSSWDDLYLCSMHGRDCDLGKLLIDHPRVFCLLDGKQTLSQLCSELEMFDETLNITVGEYLSYPEERIISGTPKEMREIEISSLSAILIERRIKA